MRIIPRMTLSANRINLDTKTTGQTTNGLRPHFGRNSNTLHDSP